MDVPIFGLSLYLKFYLNQQNFTLILLRILPQSIKIKVPQILSREEKKTCNQSHEILPHQKRLRNIRPKRVLIKLPQSIIKFQVPQILSREEKKACKNSITE